MRLPTDSWRMGSALRGAALVLLLAAGATAQQARETTVGMPGRIVDLVLPGTPLEVVPIDRNAPLVVRIVQTIGHGPGQYRYELEYYALEPGDYDLAEFLRPIDGGQVDLPEIPVTVKSQLGPGQIVPSELATHQTPRVGGYTTWLLVGAVVWVAGLFAILFVGRKSPAAQRAQGRGLTLADRLQPLVEQASVGALAREEQAELERMLLTYWRGKLGLNDLEASDAILALKEHEQAGALLRQLEAWLHMPAARRSAVNVAELLAPYRNVREDSVTGESGGAL